MLESIRVEFREERRSQEDHLLLAKLSSWSMCIRATYIRQHAPYSVAV